MLRINVFRHRNLVGENAYRDAVQQIIADVKRKYDLTNDKLAARLRCSAATISNAERKKGSLKGHVLAQIGASFEPEDLAPFTELFDALPVPNEGEEGGFDDAFEKIGNCLAHWLHLRRKPTHQEEPQIRDMLRGAYLKIGGVLHRGKAAA